MEDEKGKKEKREGRQTYSSPTAPILVSCIDWLSERMLDLDPGPWIERPLTRAIVEELSEF